MVHRPVNKTNLQVMPTHLGASPDVVRLADDIDLESWANGLDLHRCVNADLPAYEGGSPAQEPSPPMKRASSRSRTRDGDSASVKSMDIQALAGLPGHKILQYLNSAQFGKHGESNRLFEIINVSDFISDDDQEFIDRLANENHEMRCEKERLNRSNAMYENVIHAETGNTAFQQRKAAELSSDLSGWDCNVLT